LASHGTWYDADVICSHGGLCWLDTWHQTGFDGKVASLFKQEGLFFLNLKFFQFFFSFPFLFFIFLFSSFF
jgi:hypothetical protein